MLGYCFKVIIMFYGLCCASHILAQEKNDELLVHYYPGAVMQLIAPVTVPEKRALRDRYFEQNADTARQFGYQQNGVLMVDKTLLGKFKPNVFVISQWSSLKAQKAFQSLAQFTEVKSLRRQAWEALRLYDHELEAPLTLSFKKDKTYTLAFAWNNPEKANEYFRYTDIFPALLDKVKGRIIYTINNAVLSAHDPNAAAPKQIMIVEWDSMDDVEKLLELPEMINLAQKLHDTNVSFELHAASLR